MQEATASFVDMMFSAVLASSPKTSPEKLTKKSDRKQLKQQT